jgi:hypothetical protein
MPVTKTFPYNHIIKAVDYDGEHETLTVHFVRNNQSRTYEGVPKEIFYKLYYLTGNAGTMIGYYSKNIRKKFKVIDVKENGK